jgi:hypothetical protein
LYYEEIVLLKDFLFLYKFWVILFAKTTKGIKRLTTRERSGINLPDSISDALVGLFFSDGHLQRRSLFSNVRLIFSQSGKIEKRPYFELVYSLFKFCCTKNFEYYVKTWVDKKTGQEYSSISFTTMQLPCFTKIYPMWYLNKKKIVPINIQELLTPEGLAHWIMGDGSRQNLGLHLNVYAFTWDEVRLLISVLENKFNLKCSCHVHSSIGEKWRIYVWE